MSFTSEKERILGKQKGGAAAVFFTALLSAVCIFVPFIIYDGGYFLFFGDFNVQQIPFYQLCHNAIRNGEIGWSFTTDLGANFIGSYTFYTITSPFFWLTLPFPNSWVPYFMGPLLILKFACAALTAYLYIRRFTVKTLTAQLGAMLYAFSGFSVYNIFFNHFHEAIVFFPLLLLAFELLVTENRRGLFAVMVAVCAIVNYFFFVGMLVFGIIYFVVRMISKAIKPNASQIFAVFFEAVIGIGIAAVILIPSYLAIAGNDRVSNIHLGWNSLLFGKESIYANVFGVFFFPPDLPARPVMFPEANVKWSSLGAWMPVFSMVGVFAYCMGNRGSWLKRVIAVCAVMAFVPILNSAFYAFNGSYYVRWFYMPILMMALATCKAIEDNKLCWKRGFKWVGIITLSITLIIGFFPQTTDDGILIGIFTQPTNIMYIARYWITCLTALLGLAVLYLILKIRKEQLVRFLKTAIICVAIFSVGYASFFIASGKSHSFTHQAVVDDLIEGELQLGGDRDTYRIDTYSAMDNSAMFLGYSSINAFHSIVPPSVMQFYEFIGEKRDVASRPDTDLWAIRPLLSVKYLIQREGGESFVGEDGLTKMSGYNYLYNNSGFDVYENTNFIGYGFSYDAYMTYEECEQKDEPDRAKMMLRAILLDSEQIEKYGYMFDDLETYSMKEGNSASLAYTELKSECEKRNATSAESFEAGDNSFRAVVNREKDTLVFFSVPYDEGWTAYVNGEKTEVEQVNVGFMAVAVGEGTSEIVFKYETPGLTLGGAVTVSAIIVLLGYLALIYLIEKRRVPNKVCYPEGDQILALCEDYVSAELVLEEEADGQEFNC
ncbi:MAG: YfhO family protein [Clostridia bacterium]|nr:YfhO family protein [Clostridia bacterium]